MALGKGHKYTATLWRVAEKREVSGMADSVRE
jgi:hypothetical protein